MARPEESFAVRLLAKTEAHHFKQDGF